MASVYYLAHSQYRIQLQIHQGYQILPTYFLCQFHAWRTYLISNILLGLEVCCLLNKFSRRETDIESKWVGFDIPDEFVVGYGIDYAQDNRHLPFIGKVVQ